MTAVRASAEWPKGKVLCLSYRSEVLQGNPWDDPCERDLFVYLPHGYSTSVEPYLALWDLAAFTNAGPGHIAWRNHGENIPARLDRLIGEGKLPPLVVIMPDCYTSLGGNQYVNSASVGPYADYLVDELVPYVNSEFNVVDHRSGRGAFGKSSGGYGALWLAMNFPDTWGAVASHAGDVGFELAYRPTFADTCSVLAQYEGDPIQFIRAFWNKNRPTGRDFTVLMNLAMAASYDPDTEQPGKIRLPFDVRTCTLDPERWARWLACDPINMVEQHTDALQRLHGLYIDVGLYDQYNLQYGSRVLKDKLQALGVDVQYEEFDGSHSGTDWRLDHSLPYLASRLKKAMRAAI